ncbi:MAG: penicillin-binding protein 1B [Desulfobacterales bacterium]
MLLPIFLIFCMLLGVYAFSLIMLAKEKFGEKKWDLPARIYARPLELYPGMKIDAENFEKELILMQYRRVDRIDGTGSFSRLRNTFSLFSRDFRLGDDPIPAQKIRISINNQRIAVLEDLETGNPLGLARLDPAPIGSFYPTHNQDRLWVKIEEVSPLLIQTILAVEDRDFYNHYGVKPLAIVRALIANIKEGRTVQGGSTLTQQLIKNLFLTHDQSLKRKFDEAIMALSLELSYEKEQILEAYLNEVYMGQDGKRAIHGFGMAARFYFGRGVEDLRSEEIALLVGLLKGPSYYDPRRFPQRATKRRDIILKMMADQKLIHQDDAEKAMKSPVAVTKFPPSGNSRFPAFLELVKRLLLEEYPEKDLHSEGLKIYTSFDPQVQFTLENAAVSQLDAIEKHHGMIADQLETAAVVTSTASNEVLAFIGSRNPAKEGFNRGLDAHRSIGSLVKPAVYLTALNLPKQFTLITPLEDTEISIKVKTNEYWSPQNYDRQYHGRIPLYQALSHSYNVATVRLGMDLGLENVFETIHKLGINRRFDPFPSALLGTMSMSVMEVAQVYQTLAAGGFYSPVRAIQAVYKADETPLQRFPLTVKQNVDPGAVYLLNKALQTAILEGTAVTLKNILPDTLGAAGKTGTTDELRDSWFAGFTGKHLAVVWVGRDDNKPCSLTGASGALQVWGRFMKNISTAPLKLIQPENVKWVVVDPASGFRTDEWCPGAVSIPFIKGSEPLRKIPCDGSENRMMKSFSPDNKSSKSKPSLLDRIKGLF